MSKTEKGVSAMSDSYTSRRVRLLKSGARMGIIIGAVLLLLSTLIIGAMDPADALPVKGVRPSVSPLAGLLIFCFCLGAVLLGLGIFTNAKMKQWRRYSGVLLVGVNPLYDVVAKTGVGPAKVLSDLSAMERVSLLSGVIIDRARGLIDVQPGAVFLGDVIEPNYAARMQQEAKNAEAQRQLEEQQRVEQQQKEAEAAEKSLVTLPCPGCGAPTKVKKGETILCPYCSTPVAG